MNRPFKPVAPAAGSVLSPGIGPAATFARVPGERFDADQIGWSCDECGRDEYGCDCEATEPTWDDFTAPFRRLADGWSRIEL